MATHPQSSPTHDPASPENEFLLLACLTYGSDHPSRRDKARQLLKEHPELARTSIYTAAAIGDIAAVEGYLQEDPALAQAKGGPHEWEPLLYAAYSRLEETNEQPAPAPNHSTLEVARLLLEHGADANAAFLWQGHWPPFTALTGVFGEGEAGPINQPPHLYERDLAKLLLNAGADPNDAQALYNRMFTQGKSHLELLFAYGLGEESPELPIDAHRKSPSELLAQQVAWAAQHNHLDRLELFVKEGVDVTSPLIPFDAPDTMRTPYEIAKLHGHEEAALFLLAHGAKETKLSPLDLLMAACARGDAEAARALLAEDEKKTPQARTSKSPLLEALAPRQGALLCEAAARGDSRAVALMVELGFPLQGTLQASNPPSGATPLHQAAWFGHLDVAKLLVSLGASKTARDGTHNATPADWAAFNHHPEVAAFLNG